MKLAASMVVRNELHRYLRPCLDSLLEFCDTVIVMDDASEDGTLDWLRDHPDERIAFYASDRSTFFKHEGQTRQRLLLKTLAHDPTHVLSLDADELVDNGPKLRAALERKPDVPVWSLLIEEVWTMRDSDLLIREDGGWRSHPLNCLWRVPDDTRHLHIMDRRLACRRVPTVVWQQRAEPVGASLLHFGWANRGERQQRLKRYLDHDRGQFHAMSHLQSSKWADGDPRLKLRAREWPTSDAFDLLRLRVAEDIRLAQ